jgi:hypothetical protein
MRRPSPSRSCRSPDPRGRRQGPFRRRKGQPPITAGQPAARPRHMTAIFLPNDAGILSRVPRFALAAWRWTRGDTRRGPARTGTTRSRPGGGPGRHAAGAGAEATRGGGPAGGSPPPRAPTAAQGVDDVLVVAEGEGDCVVGVAEGGVDGGDELWVGVVVVGVGVGVVVVPVGVVAVGVGMAVGVREDGAVGEAGAAGDERAPWAGPKRLGPCTGWRLPVNKSAIARAATPATATAPPVATPAANARRSRLYSVRRRSRSQPGRAARRAAQLL